MLGEKFEKEILNKIKTEDLKPRWRFLLKDYVIWILGGLSVLIGGLVFSVMIYLLANGDWHAYERIRLGFLEFIWLYLPIFWIILLVIFIFSAYYYIKHTKKGYKYSILAVAALIVISSFFLGVLGCQLGLGQTIDDALGEKAPVYYEFFNPHMKIWRRPEAGMISGMVISVEKDNFSLLDVSRKRWRVFLEKKPPFPIEAGRPIKVIGEQLSEQEFRAREIIIPGPGRRFLKNIRPLPEPGSDQRVPIR